MDLTEEEISCLRYLSRHPDSVVTPCRGAVLERLVIEGLVRRQISLALPVMPQHYRYCLTTKGMNQLEQKGEKGQ